MYNFFYYPTFFQYSRFDFVLILSKYSYMIIVTSNPHMQKGILKCPIISHMKNSRIT